MWKNACNFFRHKKIRSIHFEITILYTLILGVILIIFSGVLYFIIFRTVYTEIDRELKITAQNINQTVNSYLEVRGQTPESLTFAATKTIASTGMRLNRWWVTGFERKWFRSVDELDLENNFINFYSVKSGKSLVKSSNITEDMEAIFLKNVNNLRPSALNFQNIIYQDKKMRLVSYPFWFENDDLYWIQVAVYQKPFLDIVFNWLNSIMLSIPIILLVTSFIGELLAKRILRPVHTIAATARRITHEGLGSRVNIQEPYIEMKYLIDDFNNMISRLELAFNHIEEFSSHVAHELKTPLTIIRGETELALMDTRSPEEYKKAMKINLEETDKMLRIVEDLLLLTKLNYQPEIVRFEEFDLVEYLGEVFERSRKLARIKKINLSFSSGKKPLMIKADKSHLRRLFFNLIDNALKFTPSGGKVDILIGADKDTVWVSIADTGPGIPEEDLPKVFDRFYRTDNQRPGCGLGLSIVYAIAKMHHGDVNVKSTLGQGTTFIVSLFLA